MSVDTTPATYTPARSWRGRETQYRGPRLRAGVQATWDIYVPTVTGTTNPSIGNGVLTGRYLRLGKTIICTIVMQMGSTTTYGSGTWTITLPVASVWASQTDVSMGSAHLFDTSATAARPDRFSMWVVDGPDRHRLRDPRRHRCPVDVGDW